MERKPWTNQEDQTLRNLVQEIGFTNWTLVSVKLSQLCNGSQRQGKQCRERWLNHLDLSISKKPWSKGEEKIIFQMHNIYGSKWRQISKHLKARTENDIKNHFYATMRKGIRRLNKLLGFRQNPSLLRKIKPSIISKVSQEQYKSESTTDCKQQIISVFNLILKLSRTQPAAEENQQLLQSEELLAAAHKFIDKLLKQNKSYQDVKSLKNIHKKTNSSPQNKQIKSQELNQVFDISEYLSFGSDNNDVQQLRPKSQGPSVRRESEFNQELNNQKMCQE